MTTIIQAQTAADFLALVPALAGFQPRDSIVLVAMRGNRTCGALRVDLPPENAASSARKTFATTVLGMVCKVPDVDALVPVVYTDDTFERYSGPPRRALMTVLTTRARQNGFLVRNALCVAPDGWGSYLDDGLRAGHPLDLITSSAARQNQLGVLERSPLTDPKAECTLPSADVASSDRVTRRYRDLSLIRDSAELAPTLYWEYGFDGDVVGFADDVLLTPTLHNNGSVTDGSANDGPANDDSGNDACDRDAALLAFLAQSPAVRDVFLITWGWGTSAGDECALTQRMFTAGEDISAMPGAGALGGWDMPRPDPQRIRQALDLARYTAARLPRTAQPPLLTMIGWLYWALGAGSVAAKWVDQATAIDPDFGLAELLGTMLSTGHLPDWAFDVPPEATEGPAIDSR
jgi:hypothetical protein